MHLTGQDGREELLLLRLVAVDHQRRPDGLQGDRGQRHIGTRGLVDEDLLLDRSEAQAAVLLGPADAEFPVGAHPLDHGTVGLTVPVDLHLPGLLGRDQSGEVLPQLSLQVTLLGSEFYIHCAPLQ